MGEAAITESEFLSISLVGDDGVGAVLFEWRELDVGMLDVRGDEERVFVYLFKTNVRLNVSCWRLRDGFC